MESSHFTKKYYKIKDTAEIVGVPQSTIRFWEKEFPEISPTRSSHNQRYFSPQDIETLRMIKFLVKDKGLKIEAAKDYLRNNKSNISKKIEVMDMLTQVGKELEGLLKAIDGRTRHFQFHNRES